MNLQYLYTNNWVLYSASLFDIDNVFTFLGGLKSNTISLYLTDIAHHHLYKALGTLKNRIRSLSLVGLSLITSLLAGQMYSLTPYLYLSYDYSYDYFLDSFFFNDGYICSCWYFLDKRLSTCKNYNT